MRERFGIDDVGRLAHEIARETDALGNAVESRRNASSAALAHGDGELADAGFCSSFSFVPSRSGTERKRAP